MYPADGRCYIDLVCSSVVTCSGPALAIGKCVLYVGGMFGGQVMGALMKFGMATMMSVFYKTGNFLTLTMIRPVYHHSGVRK